MRQGVRTKEMPTCIWKWLKDNTQVLKTSHTWSYHLIDHQISRHQWYCIFFISEFTDSLDSEFSFISDEEDECENTSLLSDSLVEFSHELLNLETSDSEFYQDDIISETMWVILSTPNCIIIYWLDSKTYQLYRFRETQETNWITVC